MIHKKKCQCGWIVSATTAKAAGEAIQAHCEHSKCEAIHARNV